MKKIKISIEEKNYTLEECKLIIMKNISENNYFKDNITNLARKLKDKKTIYIDITYKY